jgi:DNA mismatch endonuclease (patch repair protein)
MPAVPKPPAPSSIAATRVMQGNRGADTRPELALRSALHRIGMRYRTHIKPVGARCRADIVFPSARIAVFVDGCFWHSCPEHGRKPRTNAEYWEAKIERNVERDRLNDEELASMGWLVMRVWEHEDAVTAAQRIAATVVARRASRQSEEPDSQASETRSAAAGP